MMAKAINYVIEFKLHKSSVEALLVVYQYYLTSYEYTDLHEQLLAEHLKDMYYRIAHMDHNMMKTARLPMCNSEAMGFAQIWNQLDTSTWPLSDVIIRDMVMKIDKRVKAPKRIAYGQ